jgi:hypothetical protein
VRSRAPLLGIPEPLLGGTIAEKAARWREEEHRGGLSRYATMGTAERSPLYDRCIRTEEVGHYERDNSPAAKWKPGSGASRPLLTAYIKSGGKQKGMMRDIELAECYQSSRLRYPCRVCGERPDIIHLPTGHLGYYCRKCCPACARKKSARRWRVE